MKYQKNLGEALREKVGRPYSWFSDFSCHFQIILGEVWLFQVFRANLKKRGERFKRSPPHFWMSYVGGPSH